MIVPTNNTIVSYPAVSFAPESGPTQTAPERDPPSGAHDDWPKEAFGHEN